MLWAKLFQSCLTLCDPMDYSLLGSSVHGILLTRTLERGAIPFPRGFSQPRHGTGQNGLHKKNLQTINLREDLEKRKSSYAIDGNIN